MKHLIVFSILTISSISFAQTDAQPGKTKLSYSLAAGTGVSYFTYTSTKVKEQFASPEFRLDLGIQKQLTKKLSLHSGLRVGLKLKTTRIYSDQEYHSMSTRSLGSVDETQSRSDHYFIEIPLTIQYQYKKFKVGAGVVYRNLIQFNDTRYVIYNTTSDIGITPSLSYQLNNRLTLNTEYYFGTISFFKGRAYDNTQNPVAVKAYNRYAQISIAYSLHK